MTAAAERWEAGWHRSRARLAAEGYPPTGPRAPDGVEDGLPRRSLPGPARDRRQDGHLVVVAHGVVEACAVTVAPHRAPGQHGREVAAIARSSPLEHLADGGTGKLVASGAGGVASSGEEPEDGHTVAECYLWAPSARPPDRCPGRRQPNRSSSPSRTPGQAEDVSTSRCGRRVTVARVTRILLVRHGESEWNAAGRWQGQADPPLTELGRRQAKAAAAALGAVDLVAASDLQRARLTAEIIADELGASPVRIDPDLRERDAGAWSGLTRAEIHERWPGYLPDDPVVRGALGPTDGRRPPGWEPDEHLLARGLDAVHRLASTVDSGTALAVTHGGLVYALEAHLGAPWVRLANLQGRWVDVAADGTLALGDRLVLVDPDDVTVTVPDQI